MSSPSLGLRLTDVGNAHRLVKEHGQDLRFVPSWGWLYWDGKRWRIDPSKDGEVTRRAMTIPDLLMREAKEASDSDDRMTLSRHALATGRRQAIESMLRLTRADASLQRTPDDFDGAAHLFNVANGTIDLRSGELGAHRREHAITKLSPVVYDPAARAPRFLAFLRDITRGDEELAAYLQMAVGYSLTGDTSEQCLQFLYGDGRNGKGTFLRLLSAIAGEYYQQAEFSTFLARSNDAVREDIATLAGARIVAAEETKRGAHWDEGLVKTLTGQDTISARFLRRDRFTFRPSFKLWFAANDRPRITGVDDGIWRRVRLVPFLHKVERVDPSLEPFMRAHELSGILTWAVEGCQQWYRKRLPTPASVVAATEQYRREEDGLGEFLLDCCVISSERESLASDLYARYRVWASDQGMIEREVFSQTRFGREMSSRGFNRRRNTLGQIIRTGLALNNSTTRTVRTVEHTNSDTHTRAHAHAHWEESSVEPFNRSNHSLPLYEDEERLAMQEGA